MGWNKLVRLETTSNVFENKVELTQEWLFTLFLSKGQLLASKCLTSLEVAD